jgi:hypothetical protein
VLGAATAGEVTDSGDNNRSHRTVAWKMTSKKALDPYQAKDQINTRVQRKTIENRASEA